MNGELSGFGPDAFTGSTAPPPLARTEGPVTLVEGQTFALSGRTGDISSDLPQGLFVLDTRVLSLWELRINDRPLEPLTVEIKEPFAATFVARSAPSRGRADADLVVFRRRHIGRGMREQVSITNHGPVPAALTVELRCDVDFADLFEVKESRVRARGRHLERSDERSLRFIQRRDTITKEVSIGLSNPAVVEHGRARWQVSLGAGATWELCLQVGVTLGSQTIEPRFRCGGDDREAVPARRLVEWHARLPIVHTDHAGLAQTISRSASDLGALRIFDPQHPELPILAAGAPWFMTVFGRDSLLTAWMTLLADHSLARGVLETLARFQGSEVNPTTEEEPGKILHEMRFSGAGSLALGGGDIYYGTVDATPLFVMLLGELRRWDPSEELVDRLLPHADRALAWIEEFGDMDGDGYVEYHQRNPRGLANQGWKDSWDAVRFADGRFAEPPIALCEVQGYVYAAYVARAHFAREAGDSSGYARWARKARVLRDRFNQDFWMEEQGTYALGLDAEKRQIDAVASNVGHCLWTGIIDPKRSRSVADRLLAGDMFSGFGVRTLSSEMTAYNPVSYHNGSVWPHDNAICAAGLARYGFTHHAHRIIDAQLAVASAAGGALPELFAGFDRSELGVPAAYPTSCSPQAWAAAAPLLWLRTLLRLDPWAPHRQLWVHPDLPESIGRIRVEGIDVAGRSLTVIADSDQFNITGADGLEVVRQPRPPLTAALGPASADGEGEA